MKNIILVSMFILSMIPASGVSAGENNGTPIYPLIDGVMGVVPALENACVAVWLAIPEDQALAGIEWFNNDGTVSFPGLYFESGVPENPVGLEQTLLAAENVFGNSGAWSTVLFNESVTCASEGLYIVFRFPEGIEATGFGAGGGPAIGYAGESTGAPGWLCSDGESWDRVGGEYGFAVIPVLVEATSGMTQLNGAHGTVEMIQSDVPLVTTFHSPYPNPFNPQTKISFSLAKAQDVDLSVYDVRGRLVVKLAQGPHAAGRYSLLWQGFDRNDHRIASGVYFARFQAGNVTMNHRLVLVK